MSRIFISYRHEDSAADAGRLYDTLAAELGEEALYKDVETFAIGRSWKRAVEEALADSAAVVLVMGPAWRLSDAIKLELHLALASDVPVVPFLVRNADLAQLTSALPAPLFGISERKAVAVSHDTWRRDCRLLIDMLKRVLADPARARVLIKPPDPRELLDEAHWPGVTDKDRLLTFAQDLAECLRDPDLRRDAEDSYASFDEEILDFDRHDIPTALLETVQSGLQRLHIEHYAWDLLSSSPSEYHSDDVASLVASLGALLGDPSIGQRAWNEVKDIDEELAELSRTRGDSGNPAIIKAARETLNDMVQSTKARLVKELPGIDQPGFTNLYPDHEWPEAAFGKTKQYGRPGYLEPTLQGRSSPP